MEGSIGATLWMLVAGVLTVIRNIPTGMFVVLLFALPNVIGLLLWHSRRLSCYNSTQLLIAISAICGLLAVYALERANSWTQIQSGGSVSTLSIYWIIAMVFAGLMIMFYLRFGRNEKGLRSNTSPRRTLSKSACLKPVT